MPNKNRKIVIQNEERKKKDIKKLKEKIFGFRFDSLSTLLKLLIAAVPCVFILCYFLFYLDVFKNGEVDYLIAVLSFAVLVYTFVGKHKYILSDILLVLTLYFGMLIPLILIKVSPFNISKHATVISAICLLLTIAMEVLDCIGFYFRTNKKKIKEVESKIEEIEHKSIMS